MIERFLRVTDTVQWLLSEVLRSGDIAVDMTAGNGYDTLLLAELVGPEGKVIAVDIQQQALDNTKALLDKNGLKATLIREDHANLYPIWEKYKGKVKAVTYNLGFLPGSDHRIMTEAESTLHSIRESLGLLKSGGIITVCTYPHEEGAEEKRLLEEFLHKLSDPYDAFEISRLNRKNPPELIVIGRK